MAIPAIDAIIAYMMFMAEGNRLIRSNAHIGNEVSAVD
jgi:hypothetical protein